MKLEMDNISKDILLVKILPCLNPKDFLNVLKLNRKLNSIASLHPIYKYLRRKQYRDVYNILLNCAQFGDINWVIFYKNEYMKEKENENMKKYGEIKLPGTVLIASGYSGNIDLISYLYNIVDKKTGSRQNWDDEYWITKCFSKALEKKKEDAVQFILKKYKLSWFKVAKTLAKCNRYDLLNVSEPNIDREKGFYWNNSLKGSCISGNLEMFEVCLDKAEKYGEEKEDLCFECAVAIANKNYNIAEYIIKIKSFNQEKFSYSLNTLCYITKDISTINYFISLIEDRKTWDDCIGYYNDFNIITYIYLFCTDSPEILMKVGILMNSLIYCKLAVTLGASNYDNYCSMIIKSTNSKFSLKIISYFLSLGCDRTVALNLANNYGRTDIINLINK